MERNDIDMIKSPAKWPMLALPLKRTVNGRIELGFVMCEPKRGHYALFTGNVFDIESHKLALDNCTPEQLVALGWKVD